MSLDMTPELEEALHALYKGQTNVAVKAMELGVSIVELKAALIAFIKANPLNESVWRRDFELGWPYTT